MVGLYGIFLIFRLVCDIEGFNKLVVNSAGEGGYDECIKHLDDNKVRVWDGDDCAVPVRSHRGHCSRE